MANKPWPNGIFQPSQVGKNHCLFICLFNVCGVFEWDG